MNRRRTTNGLARDQVNEMTYGWEHARRINRPLNVMITFRPFEDLDQKTCCEFAARLRHKLCIYARQHGFDFVAAWARECNRDGTGEHVHILMHVPPRHCADLEKKIIGWHPEPAAADLTPANQRVVFTDNGFQRSAIGYVCKQMTPQAWYKRGLTRKAGGPILGKRGGVTRNIGPVAIGRYFEDLKAQNQQLCRPSCQSSYGDDAATVLVDNGCEGNR
jgi:hypothetical protein